MENNGLADNVTGAVRNNHRYNFGSLWQLESVLSANNLNSQEALMINVIEKWFLFAFH